MESELDHALWIIYLVTSDSKQRSGITMANLVTGDTKQITGIAELNYLC